MDKHTPESFKAKYENPNSGLLGGPPTFRSELASVINRYSKESGSNTPDFILAEFLCASLAAFDAAIAGRSHWYGVTDTPASPLGGSTR
jgi:hypothetical protein